LTQNGVSWKYYTHAGIPGIWNPLPHFTTVHDDGDLGNIVSSDEFFQDAADGTLPSVSWVAPNQTVSEHPPALVSTGQAWVTSLVNAVMQSPNWDSTAIFISWDDWGGFYDHEVPPQPDQNGYGLRVPGLVISPWAKQGYIDDQVLSFDAYLKFIEDDFLGSQRLDPATDGRPDPRISVRENSPLLGDLLNDFDFSQTPQPGVLLSPWPITPEVDNSPIDPSAFADDEESLPPDETSGTDAALTDSTPAPGTSQENDAADGDQSLSIALANQMHVAERSPRGPTTAAASSVTTAEVSMKTPAVFGEAAIGGRSTNGTSLSHPIPAAANSAFDPFASLEDLLTKAVPAPQSSSAAIIYRAALQAGSTTGIDWYSAGENVAWLIGDTGRSSGAAMESNPVIAPDDTESELTDSGATLIADNGLPVLGPPQTTLVGTAFDGPIAEFRHPGYDGSV
jgi:hypothetical protein